MKLRKFPALAAFLLIGWSCQSWSITLDQLIPGSDPLVDDGTIQWQLTDRDGIGPDDSNALIFRESAGFANTNTLSLYDVDDPSRRVEIFSGPDGVFDSVTMTFDIVTGVWENFNTGASIAFTPGGAPEFVFGLVLGSPEGDFFCDPSLNSDGFDHCLTYDSVGSAGLAGVFDYIIGFEDLLGGGDQDFDDMVVGMTDVQPFQVASPAPLALVGLGVLALGFLGVPRRQ